MKFEFSINPLKANHCLENKWDGLDLPSSPAVTSVPEELLSVFRKSGSSIRGREGYQALQKALNMSFEIFQERVLISHRPVYRDRLDVDGRLGAITKEAVELFQRVSCIKVDGVPGKEVIVELAKLHGWQLPSASDLKDINPGFPSSVPIPGIKNSRIKSLAEAIKQMKHIDLMDPILVMAEEHTGLDRHLLIAIIFAESSFNPLAHSRAGARGLMQVVPKSAGAEVVKIVGNKKYEAVTAMVDALTDASDISFYKNCKVRPANSSQPKDMVTNLCAGAVYLYFLDRKYGENDWARTLTAYRGGPGGIGVLKATGDKSHPDYNKKRYDGRKDAEDYVKKIISVANYLYERKLHSLKDLKNKFHPSPASKK